MELVSLNCQKMTVKFEILSLSIAPLITWMLRKCSKRFLAEVEPLACIMHTNIILVAVDLEETETVIKCQDLSSLNLAKIFTIYV